MNPCPLSQGPAYADLETGADSPLLHLDRPSGIRDVLPEPDCGIQHVVECHLDREMPVDLVGRRKIKSMERHLLHITEPHDADRMYPRALKIVQEGKTEAGAVSESRGNM